ncbi:helix-turn-helix transcriptional regulator [Actinotignum sanguinis]|uniref:helix-turn-helix transcriptional regulator n=1 Tax=Actinotignum sanguinis TaxID=1445614 RepID=UPI002549FF98|nr:hypothetical protein [Actinotignum sanguinis]MDK8656353.1 hypothetical protein [Actinotignum sanguinis]
MKTNVLDHQLGNDDNRVLSSAQAAQYLGVSMKTLANWRRLGIGPRFFRRSNTVDSRGHSVGRVGYKFGDVSAYANERFAGNGGL